jgi:predicted kinase
MPTLTIIRGVSGSGKTTLAQKIGAVVMEADQYFEDAVGGYNFDASKLKEAHAYCKSGVDYWMKHNHDVVVSNTFTRRWEFQPYLDMADGYDYDVQVITVEGNFGSIHNVPDEVIQKQRDRWEY